MIQAASKSTADCRNGSGHDKMKTIAEAFYMQNPQFVLIKWISNKFDFYNYRARVYLFYEWWKKIV